MVSEATRTISELDSALGHYLVAFVRLESIQHDAAAHAVVGTTPDAGEVQVTSVSPDPPNPRPDSAAGTRKQVPL